MLNEKYGNDGSIGADSRDAEQQSLSIYGRQEGFMWGGDRDSIDFV